MAKYEQHALDGISILKEPSVPYFIRMPNEIFPFCSDILPLQQECFFVITLNTRNRVITRRLISFGLLDSCLVHPREVFRYAVQSAAKFLIVLHNHPSGDVTPSSDDIRITRQLVDAGKILDIKVEDHLIIGTNEFGCDRVQSIRETGSVTF